uniref:hypothetical protein n=1 Tax=Flavobacterium sp. TaxID=239 RepID=UPI00404ADDD9
MKKTYDIEIGNKILINKIGVFLGIVGVVFTILIGLSIISSILMPNEMTVVYIIEFFENKIYLVLLTSILLFIIGMQIAKIRNYKSSELTIEAEKISFLKNGELIEIPEPRLHKITERKNRFSKVNLIKIKTDTHKEYDIKGTNRILEHLTELFPNKTELKNVG